MAVSLKQICCYFVTVQQVCALAALTARKLRQEGKNPIGAADLGMDFCT
jgi:hypothetical protein